VENHKSIDNTHKINIETASKLRNWISWMGNFNGRS